MVGSSVGCFWLAACWITKCDNKTENFVAVYHYVETSLLGEYSDSRIRCLENVHIMQAIAGLRELKKNGLVRFQSLPGERFLGCIFLF